MIEITRRPVHCTKCGGPVEFNDAGDACKEYYGSRYIIECDCTGVPVANWDGAPDYWSGVGIVQKSGDGVER